VTGSPICITSVKNVWSSTNCFFCFTCLSSVQSPPLLSSPYVWFPAAVQAWTSLVLLLASPLQDKFQFLGDFRQQSVSFLIAQLSVFFSLFVASLLEVWAETQTVCLLYELCEESLNVFYLFCNFSRFASLNSLTNFFTFFFISTLGLWNKRDRRTFLGWQLPILLNLFEFGLHLFKFLSAIAFWILCALRFISGSGVGLNVTGSPIVSLLLRMSEAPPIVFSASRVCPAFKASFTFFTLTCDFRRGSGLNVTSFLLASRPHSR